LPGRCASWRLHPLLLGALILLLLLVTIVVLTLSALPWRLGLPLIRGWMVRANRRKDRRIERSSQQDVVYEVRFVVGQIWPPGPNPLEEE
jgi:hypothetical protein